MTAGRGKSGKQRLALLFEVAGLNRWAAGVPFCHHGQTEILLVGILDGGTGLRFVLGQGQAVVLTVHVLDVMAHRKPWRERIESDHGNQQLRQ